MRYSIRPMQVDRQKLEGFKNDLLAKKEALLKDLHETNAEMIADQENFSDSIDQASADSDKTLILQIKNRNGEVLQQIDEALRRIDLGSFGECESCGEEIGRQRIQANLATTLCIDCQAELESNRLPRR